MSETLAKTTGSAVIPGMRYRDAHRAIEWLVRALGFVRGAVYEGPDGRVMHAQLTFGSGMIFIGSPDDTGLWRRLLAQPDEIGGRETVVTCLTAEDATQSYERARAAGAEMLEELTDMSWGGKQFVCRDPEGHVWCVGDSDPWAFTEQAALAV